MRFIRSAAIALGLAAASAAGAGDVRIDRVEIVDTGVYTVALGAVTEDPSAPGGKVVAPDETTLVEETATVAARVGLEFGLRYVIVGEPEGAMAPLDFVFRYPPPGLKDPAEAEPLTETRFSREKAIGETLYLGYGFESDWEIVPGEWTFEIWSGGRKLAEQSLTAAK